MNTVYHTARRLLLLLSLLLWMGTAAAQTLSGTVTDASTGETLIGATVVDLGSGKGTLTNAHGRYSLTLGGGEAAVRVSYVGYVAQSFTLNLEGNPVRNVALVPAVELDEVVITAERMGTPRISQMSAVELPVEQVKLVPVLFGETDVLKAIQLLPGVQSGGEGMSGIYVRGGGPDENLFLLDGVPLYNVNHLGGFFSAFNGDAVKGITLYKGSFPARFAGRISSVLDIVTNDGNDREWHGSGSVGLLSAKFSVEGPIIKERTTLSLSFRRTYADLLLKPMMLAVSQAETGMKMNVGYYFYDLNGKVTHRFNDRSRLYASFYSGDDGVYASIKTSSYEGDGYRYDDRIGLSYKWGNLLGSLRWNYQLTPRLFLNLTAAYTHYRNNLGFDFDIYSKVGADYMDAKGEMTLNSSIRDVIGRIDLDYAPSTAHSVRLGAVFTHHIFTPQVIGTKHDYASSDTSFAIDTTTGGGRIRAQEFSLYAEDDWTLLDPLKLNIGVAAGGFRVQGKFYPSVEPRLSARYLLTDDLSLKVGYAYMKQYLHLLSNSNISLSTDLWVPVTERIEPMSSHQTALGLFYNWRGLVDLSVEGYYKQMYNLMEFLPGSNFWNGDADWEGKVCLGNGWAYGVELLAQKSVGKLTGWVGYTLSRTMRKFDQLNEGRPFPAKYDRIHDLSLTLQYRPSKRFDCGITWVYSTGNTATLALQRYEAADPGVDAVGYIEHRNNYRLPAYHRMDISVNFHKQKKHGVRTWNISVYNLYNRRNPYLIYHTNRYSYTAPSGHRYGSALVQLSLFPILPSVSYTYKF